LGIFAFYQYTQDQAAANAFAIVQQNEEQRKIDEENKRVREEQVKFLKESNEKELLELQVEALENRKASIRNNWNENFIIKGSYTYNEFGGISGLFVDVLNNTEFPVEKVEVLLTYIKSNGDQYKVETIIVNNIPAHGKTSERAPNSDRGTKVKHEILSINSKALNFCYTASKSNSSSLDPYRCD
jgi:hypothetical protein